jgi:nitrogen fixation/metabolism regulation signal transduction histidine kinase
MSRILFEPKQRLLWRVLLAFTLVLAIQAGFAGYLVYRGMDRLLQANLDGRLLRVGALAADDPVMTRTLAVQVEDKNARRILNETSSFLRELTSLVDVRRGYLFRVEKERRTKNPRFLYLAGTIDTESLEKVPTPVLNAEELASLRNGRTITSRPFRLDSGALMKAVYVPILQSGEFAGLLAFDDDAQDLELLQILWRQLLAITFGAFVIASIVSYIVARTIVGGVRRLVAAAEDMGTGAYTARFKVTGADEINFLGQTFNDMAEDIQARDDQIRKMNEAALADARELYEHVLRAAYSAILTANDDDLLTSENPAAARLLGPPPDGPLTVTRRLAPFPELLKLWRGRSAVRDREVTIAHRGEVLVLEATLTQLTDHRNEPIGLTLTLVDRTEIKRLQQELTMRDRLAALGELAAGIAHEIRNPLNGIQLMLGLVQEDLTDKGVVDTRFKNIHDEVTRLNTILNDFLLFARPKPLERSRANLIELTEDAIMLVLPHIENRGVELIRNFTEAEPITALDAAAIRRVMVNLIKNACEAMNTGGKLYLTIAGPETTGDGFRMQVRDTGPGIETDVAERLFNPFVTTKDEGTGLGLSIVHKAIVNHGGSITCENHPEGGACFTITLPETEA